MNIDTALFFGHSPVHTTCRNPSNRTTVFQCKCVPCISVSFSFLSVFTVYVDREYFSFLYFFFIIDEPTFPVVLIVWSF